MNAKWSPWISAGLFAVALLGLGGVAAAQSSQPPPPQQGAQQTDKDKQPSPAPLTLDAAPPPVSAEEEAAFKAFQDVPTTDKSTKIQTGEDFLKKYPQSRYRVVIYSNLASAYFASGQVQKLTEVAGKELEINPNDVAVMAIMAQTLSRTYKANTPTPQEAAKQLQQAEQYAKRTIEITPTMPKPANLTDEAFANAKADTLEMAHSSLGLVYLQRGKFGEAIPELEDAIKADRNSDPDPVNYYLLGIANDNSSHFDAASQAFAKCGSLQGTLQTTCQKSAEASKKKGATQLSAPK